MHKCLVILFYVYSSEQHVRARAHTHTCSCTRTYTTTIISNNKILQPKANNKVKSLQKQHHTNMWRHVQDVKSFKKLCTTSPDTFSALCNKSLRMNSSFLSALCNKSLQIKSSFLSALWNKSLWMKSSFFSALCNKSLLFVIGVWMKSSFLSALCNRSLWVKSSFLSALCNRSLWTKSSFLSALCSKSASEEQFPFCSLLQKCVKPAPSTTITGMWHKQQKIYLPDIC